MMTDYDGVDVIDAQGDGIGHVEHTYVDDQGVPRYVEVKLGTIFAKHRLIALDKAELDDDGLHVPYAKSTVEGSPDASEAHEAVDGDLLGSVANYYDRAATTDAIMSPTTANDGS